MVVKGHNKKPEKKMIYNSMVKSVLTYGAETWSYVRMTGGELTQLRWMH